MVELSSPVALAGDGILEIDQTCAVGAGCFPGDAAGFPITINSPGSYRLTSDLETAGEPDAQTLTAIRIAADGVTLDLSGFALRGPVSCSGIPASCTSSEVVAHGVEIPSTFRSAAVRNGSISGMPGNGIHGPALVEFVLLRENAGSGAEDLLAISNSLSESNGGAGIRADRVNDCIARLNGSEGIRAELARSNVAADNGADGIASRLATGNVSRDNGRFGISGDAVANNLLWDNDEGDFGPNLFDLRAREIGDNLCMPAGVCTFCGDGNCEGRESGASCSDCSGVCGDGHCSGIGPDTVCDCAADCGAHCPDGLCNCGETAITCSLDCR